MLQWKGLTRDSKVNPDVLLLLISPADEWEGKITGASQGGPVCCPATQALPSSPPQLRQPQQIGMRTPVGRDLQQGEAVREGPRGFSTSNNQQAGRQAGSRGGPALGRAMGQTHGQNTSTKYP